MFKKIADTIFLLRPTLLVPVWTIIMLGWITGGSEVVSFDLTKGSPEFWALFFAFTGVVGYIYILNQIADIDGDRKNGKLFILPGGHLPVWYAWIIAILSGIMSIVISVLWLDVVALVLMCIGLVLGFFYSFSPWPLKDRPWGGLWGNCLGHGIVTYLVGWYAANYGCSVEQLATGVLASLSAGFANGAVYLTTTIPDIDGDREVGKKTFAVVYGSRKTAILAAVFVTLSVATIPLLTINHWVMAVPAVFSMILFWRAVILKDNEKAFNTAIIPILFLSASVALFIPSYALLVVIVSVGSHFYYKKRFNLIYPSFMEKVQ